LLPKKSQIEQRIEYLLVLENNNNKLDSFTFAEKKIQVPNAQRCGLMCKQNQGTELEVKTWFIDKNMMTMTMMVRLLIFSYKLKQSYKHNARDGDLLYKFIPRKTYWTKENAKGQRHINMHPSDATTSTTYTQHKYRPDVVVQLLQTCCGQNSLISRDFLEWDLHWFPL
jgi:hypothetical protein